MNVIIVLEGGLVSDIISDSPDLHAFVIDYDIEGADENDLTPIPQGGSNSTILAFAHEDCPTVNVPICRTFIRAIRKEA